MDHLGRSNHLSQEAEYVLSQLRQAPLLPDFLSDSVITELKSVGALTNFMSADGVAMVALSSQGRNIMDSKIAIQRQAGAGGTMISYNEMFATMTPAALNALTKALATSGRLRGSDVTRSTATLFLERMMEDGFLNLPYNSTVLKLADFSARSIMNRVSTRSERMAVVTSMMTFWQGSLLDILREVVEETGGVKTITPPYIYGQYSLDTVIYDGSIFVATGQDRWSGDEVSFSIDELPLAAVEYFM